MPDGKTHNKGLMVIGPVTGIAAWVSTGDPLIGAAASIGVASGVFLTPDLDIDGNTESDWQVRVWFGIVVLYAWKAIWWSYGKAIPHRSPISHWPILSTILRLLYLELLIRLFTVGNVSILIPSIYFIWWAIGLAAADFTHWAMDQKRRRY